MTRTRTTADPAIDRRRFVLAAALGACSLAAGAAHARALRRRTDPLVLVRFGGGVRTSDVLGEKRASLTPFLRTLARGGVLVPELWTDAAPRHDVGTLQLLTGRAAGTGGIEALRTAPLLSEALRTATAAPARSALAIAVPASSHAAQPGHKTRALSFDAPKALARARSISGDPTLDPATAVFDANERIARTALALGDRGGLAPEAWGRRVAEEVAADLAAFPHAEPEVSPMLADALVERLVSKRAYIAPEESDDWLVELALASMARLRPTLTTLALSTPDLAHMGAWSVYAQALRRLDQLLNRLVRFLDDDPFYRGRATLLIAPDCGRGHERFDRHDAPDDASVRRLFLIAHGPRVPPGRVVAGRRHQVDVAPTAARLLGFDLAGVDGAAIQEVCG